MFSEDQMFYEQGLKLGQAGRYAEARAALEEAQRLNPERQDAPLALARLACQHGDLTTAHHILSERLQHQTQAAEVHFELGHLFQKANQWDHALNYYRAALRLDPQLSEAWIELGQLLHQIGQYDAACSALEEAIKTAPESAAAWNLFGLTHYFLKNASAAREALQQAVSLKPRHGDYLLNLGMSYLLSPVDLEQGLHILTQAIECKPEHAQELIKVGDHFAREGYHELALRFYAPALPYSNPPELLPFKMGESAEKIGNIPLALRYFEQVLSHNPHLWAVEIRAALMLPTLYQSRAELIAWRDRFIHHLAHLRQHIQPLARASQHLPYYSAAFLLAYQGFDNRVLLEQLSDFWRQQLQLPQTARRTLRQRKRRIGVASSFFFQHSITGCYLELLRVLKQRGHELYTFALGTQQQDEVWAEIQNLSHYQTFAPHTRLPQIAQHILDTDLDILIYPELGLDPLSYFLAHGRLAPQQVMLMGHPCTSGIATMDRFISALQLEDTDADSHYTEKLVRLSRIPFVYEAPQMPDTLLSREALNLPTGRLYVVAGTLFKLHPDHDPIFEAILQQDPEAHILLIQGSRHSWHQALETRFDTNLAPFRERLHILPWLDKQAFYSLLLQADALLDTLHFGAGNVAYQALGLGVAPITLPGRFFRSRTTLGIYTQMNFFDCVAHSPQEFVALCLRMAQDPHWKHQIREKIQARQHLIFNDTAIMAELADYLEGPLL